MAKIHSILQGGEFYYKLALEQIAEENYTDAIKNLIRATRLSRQDKYFIELAEAYYSVDAFDMSARVYFKLLAAHPAMDYLLAISRNLIEMGKEEIAAEFAYKTLLGYGKKMSEKPVKRLSHVVENDKMRQVFSTASAEPGPVLINIAEKDEYNILDRAFELYERGDFDGAVALALKVPVTSARYIRALEIISAATMENGDEGLALKAAALIQEREPYNILAFRVYKRYRAVPEGVLNERQLAEKVISALKEKNDCEALGEFIRYLHSEGSFEEVYMAAEAACSINGAHPANLFNLALSAFILGKNEQGERAMHKFAELYPDHELAKMLLWRFEKRPSPEDWKADPGFFCGEIIADYKKAAKASARLGVMSEKEQDLMDIILACDQTEDSIDLIYDVLESGKKGAKEYFIKKLVDHGPETATRITLFKILIECGAEGTVSVLLPDRMVECELKSPGKLPAHAEHFIVSYSEVYLELLAEGDNPHPNTLGIVLREIAKTKSRSNKIHIVAAVIHYHYVSLFGESITLSRLAAIYGTTRQTIKKYLDIYKFDII